ANIILFEASPMAQAWSLSDFLSLPSSRWDFWLSVITPMQARKLVKLDRGRTISSQLTALIQIRRSHFSLRTRRQTSAPRRQARQRERAPTAAAILSQHRSNRHRHVGAVVYREASDRRWDLAVKRVVTAHMTLARSVKPAERKVAQKKC